jgi:hypothetical protein
MRIVVGSSRFVRGALVAVIVIPAFSFTTTGVAVALPSCGPLEYDWIGHQWQDNTDAQIKGVRAPIQLRKDSTLCSGGTDPFTANWIAITDTTNQISQAGWVHEDGAYCAFWAVNTGTSHDYSCGLADDTYRWFEVQQVQGVPDYLQVLDCGGGGGYSACTVKGTDNTYAVQNSQVATETDYGLTQCTIVENGTSADRVNFGTSSYPMQFKYEMGGSWGTPAASVNFAPGCTHYTKSYSSSASTMTTWDDRN